MRKIVVFVLILLVLPVVSSQYIIGDIYIRDNGKVDFFVDTDIDPIIEGLIFSDERLEGNTDLLTSKIGDRWSFSLNLGNYETILLDVHLPKSTERVYNLSGIDRIFDVDDKTISLVDGDKNLIFKVEYSVGKSEDYSLFYFGIFIVIVGIVYFLFLKKTKRKKMIKQAFPYVNDQEKKILDLLMDNSMRQKQVREKLGIPKASFTRYIINLEKKKLIFREGEGKNKVLKLR